MSEAQHFFSITIPQLINKYGIKEELNNNFIITSQVAEYLEALSFPLRIDALIIGICMKGSIKVTVNLKLWEPTENICFFSFPENVIGIYEISDDFQGVIIGISLDYLKEMNIDLKDILPYYISVRNYPCVRLEDKEAERLIQIYELIMLSLRDTRSNRKEEIVKGLFSALVFMIADGLDRISKNIQALKTKSKEYYFVRFIELLLRDFRKYRYISYYSDKLSVTPKYLSALIKEISGTSAAQWIDEYTITEASILLRFSDKNISQIANELNFPSQSFFSKYFKQHTGKTPSEYREETKKG